MASASLLVPPFLKIAHGPLLGPAMLVGAAHQAGHDVRVYDLNAAWIRERLCMPVMPEKRMFIGDHDRPPALSQMHDEFMSNIAVHTPRDTHETILSAAEKLASGVFGTWTLERLRRPGKEPDVIGVSVMYRHQVEPALAMTVIARKLWPRALVVWGGAHVTALRDDIALDIRYACRGLIDRFVFGYAERTWCALLAAVAGHEPLPKEVVCAGCGYWLRAMDDPSVVPVFGDLRGFDPTLLTLPVQSSRGCTYGVCTYCTYPSIEGSPREVLWPAIDPVIEHALRTGAALSFKDSLVEGARLEAIAERIDGRTAWSACTKLDARLPGRLARLDARGCRTLEIGLETIDTHAQAMIMKRQKRTTFSEFLDAASATNISVVVNCITGFPGVDPSDEAYSKAIIEHALKRRRPALVSKLEHNQFQLERLAPMALTPEQFSMRITKRSPWASVLEWEPGPQLVSIRKRRSPTE